MQITPRLRHFLAAIIFYAVSSHVISAEPNKPDPKAPEMKYQAILVWGTDEDKPPDKNLKDIDPSLHGPVEKLKKWLKWKNYYEVNRKEFTIRAGENKRLKLSDKCELQV